MRCWKGGGFFNWCILLYCTSSSASCGLSSTVYELQNSRQCLSRFQALPGDARNWIWKSRSKAGALSDSFISSGRVDPPASSRAGRWTSNIKFDISANVAICWDRFGCDIQFGEGLERAGDRNAKAILYSRTCKERHLGFLKPMANYAGSSALSLDLTIQPVMEAGEGIDPCRQT